MSSLRQIEANRRNARLSTGPVTDKGKEKSRRNALRHGLTAETVIHAIEDADDYAAFEMAVTADFDPQSAVERELCCGWQACCGDCVAPPPSRPGCSKTRRESSRGLARCTHRAARLGGRPATKVTNTVSAIPCTIYAITLEAPMVSSTGSRVPSFASQTCRVTRSIGSTGMRPRCGARPARSYSHCGVSIVAGHGRFGSSARADEATAVKTFCEGLRTSS